jgi:uncharacterized small protein (DUF1192 family)
MNSSLWRVLLPHTMGDTDPPDAPTARAYKLAAADAEVRTLILMCVNELRNLVDEGAAEHFLHAAVQGAATLDSTPIDWLKTQIGMLRAEIDKVKQERQRATKRRLQEVQARKPLTDLVQRLSVAATNERDALGRQLDALRGEAPRKSRHQELRAAGLNDEQIATLRLPPEQAAEDEQVAAIRERIAVLEGQLAKYTGYEVDPLHDPERLRGLGFDELIDAQATACA